MTRPVSPAPTSAALATRSAYDPTKPLAVQLAAAAMREFDELVKFNLTHARDQLVDAIGKFEKVPSGDNLIVVNGFWTHGVRMLEYAGKRNPGGGAGLRDGAQIQKVA